MDFSMDKLEQSAVSLIENAFPISEGNLTLDVSALKINRPAGYGTIAGELAIKNKNGSLEGSISGDITITDASGKKIENRRLIILRIPYISKRGTFIVNGTERVVMNQMVSKAGVYTTNKADSTHTTVVLSNYVGPKIDISMSDDEFKVTLKGKGESKNFSGMKFLKFIGLTDGEIRSAIGSSDYAERLLRMTGGGQGSLADLFALTAGRNGASYPGDAPAVFAIRDFFANNTVLGDDEKEVIGVTLGKNYSTFNIDAIMETIKKTIAVRLKEVAPDKRDELVFQNVYNANDLMEKQIAKGLESFKKSAAQMLIQKKSVSSLSSPLNKMNKEVGNFLKKDSRSDLVDQTNPLNLISAKDTVTALGEGGLSSENAGSVIDPRNIKQTATNRLDPIHTPESGNVGLVLKLSQNAEVKNKTITSKYLRFSRNKSDSTQIVELTPSEERVHYVAYNDPAYFSKIGKDYILIAGKSSVWARYRGEDVLVSPDKVEYLDSDPKNIFGLSSNMIPYGHHNDGNRMLFGANMQTQAMNLVTRQAPLVQNRYDETRSYEDYVGERSFTVKSDYDGEIHSVTDDAITVKDDKGKTHTTELYNYFPLNMGNHIKNDALVKAGDKVSSGQLIADGWQTKNGSLALGINARVAYMPFEGSNYEDNFAVSESFAKSVVTKENMEEEVVIRESHIGGPGSGAKKMMTQFLNSARSLANLDDDGIIKEGSIVGPGDIVVGRLKKVDVSRMSPEEQILAAITGNKDKYEDASHAIPTNSYTKGKVIRVVKTKGGDKPTDKWTIAVTILMQKTLKLGDKLSGRHGNKGTVGLIIPDNEMPISDYDKKPIDMLLSPLGVPSRKNIGQVMEVGSGLLAEIDGKPRILESFTKNSADGLLEELNAKGITDGKMKVFDPVTKTYYENPVTVGNMYVMKLKHKVDDKIQARSAIEGSAPNIKYMSPSKSTGKAAGERHNPQAFGEMEFRALQGHKAVNNILEATTLKGDGAGDAKTRASIFRVLSGRDTPDALSDLNGTPESLRIMRDYMKSMGLAMEPKMGNKGVVSVDDVFTEISLRPYNDAELVKSIGRNGLVTEGKTFFAQSNKTDTAEKGGIFDAEIFGDANSDDPDEKNKARKNWGYIKLNSPQVYPIFLNAEFNPYKTLTGLKSADVKRIAADNTHVLITNPGDTGLGMHSVITAEKADQLETEGLKFEYETGGTAIKNLLAKVDLNKELQETKKKLKVEGPAMSTLNRDTLYKKFRMLDALDRNGLKPTDLVTEVIPVMPQYLRPRMQIGNNVVSDDMNKLYTKIIIANNAAGNVLAPDYVDFATAKDRANAGKSVYDQLSDYYGTSIGVDAKGKEMHGIKDLLRGKEGLVRKRMLSKKVDYSGRAVIGNDPGLKLDQIGLPIDIAKTTYKPFLLKALVDRGVAIDLKEAEKKMNTEDPLVIKALEAVMKERPTMLNRAPSLHKFSVMAFEPVLKQYDKSGNPIRTIQLNPLVAPMFNADFDGDQMAAHVPISPGAVREARTMMMPSQNLMNPTDGKIIVEIRHEMLLGIYYLTMNPTSPEGPKIAVSDAKKLMAAYKKGRVTSRQPATFEGRTTTVGQILFNSMIPKKYQAWDVTMGKKQIGDLIERMYMDKGIGKLEIANIISDIKDLGFLASTRSSLSIGLADLKRPDGATQKINDVIARSETTLKNDPSKLIAVYKDLEDSLKSEYANNSLGVENPVNIMMMSGARGTPDQIRRMAATVGIGRDVTETMTAPVFSSHLDGLNQREFYLHAYDSRKGIYDRAVSTSKPGELTRNVWSSIQDQTITEADCKTRKGIMAVVDKTIIGRLTAEDVQSIIPRDKMITKAVFDRLVQMKVLTVIVRSPMTCESVKGVCQKCYGSLPGDMTLASLGDPIGVLASQAIGEPTTQMTMNTFHTGGTASSATLGLPRVSEIISAKKDVLNKAILAKCPGIIKIDRSLPSDVTVSVGGVIHRTADKPLRVKDGDVVMAGDFLTVGSIEDFANKDLVNNKNIVFTSANPHEFMELNKYKGQDIAVDNTKEYLAKSMNYAISKTLGGSPIDNRHVETIVNKMVSKASIISGGDSSYVPGQIVTKSEIDNYNNVHKTKKWVKLSDGANLIGFTSAQNCKAKGSQNIIMREGEEVTPDMIGLLLMAGYDEVQVYPKKVAYKPLLMSLEMSSTKGTNDWFSSLGYEDPGKFIAQGALYGQTDKLEDIRGRQMAGFMAPIGEGFDKLRDKGGEFVNSIGNTLMSMFK